jgi:hypothetical protein
MKFKHILFLLCFVIERSNGIDIDFAVSCSFPTLAGTIIASSTLVNQKLNKKGHIPNNCTTAISP